MADLDDELVHGLAFHTEEVLATGPTATPKEHALQIFPQTREWTFRILATFLNERDHSWTMKDPIRLRTTDEFGKHYVGVCKRTGVRDCQNVRFRFLPHGAKGKFKIVVDADVAWFKSDWTACRRDILTTTDTHCRTLASPKEKPFIQYSWSLPPFADLRPSSQAFLGGDSVVLTEPSWLSQPFRLFIKHCRPLPLRRDWETNFLYDLAEALDPPPRPVSIPNLGALGKHLHGHLLLTVMDREFCDPYPGILDQSSGSLKSIVRGCYVTPYAQALMTQNRELIDGLLLDATFKIIPKAVASIMNLSICNVGIPVALAFGPVEDSNLYETFYRVFKQLFGIDLNGYCVVSDQGSALRAVCGQHKNPQFFCLHHVLVNLKRKRFSEEVGNLVRCRVREDYDRLCAVYTPIFAAAEGANARLLVRTLAKVGLAFESGEIRKSNRALWESVSMMTRVVHRLPSTSNALESAHGHANEDTPRRNEFLASVRRVGLLMIRKTFSFRQALKHNFRATVFKAHRRYELMDRDLMRLEIEQYGTALDGCGCGETVHLSLMYRTQCPCSHQFALGAPKPKVPNIGLILSDAASRLIVEIERVGRTIVAPVPRDQREHFERIAVEHIQRFSHAGKKRKEEIVTYVREHFLAEDGFAMGLPVSLYVLISNGIHKFSA
jgi:hypothetical protein